ncbi:pentatricopeptide repeat-containing protein At3g29230-like [Impatiens glandulifera]|uniref:pentatricopeptide repeat-containing protein At3g29230-like n=1 Tax=Impatiens glandulifera TaxID=253017 RepID=UPI001FB04ECF|nr:pentatricopeptide repeat-containing protein At3g29230-like [Impatiens glandulifera]
MASSVYSMKNQLTILLKTAKTRSQIRKIHAQLITTNLIGDPFIAGRLLFLLASNITTMTCAELVFSQIHEPNTFSWNTIMNGHISTSNPRKALDFFTQMRNNGITTDAYTYSFVLKACGIIGGLLEGMVIHGEVAKTGFCSNVFVRNGLIGMYWKCKEKGSAELLFGGFLGRDSASWNLMLNGYVGCGDMNDAQKLFDEMPKRDVFSWSIMIDGYGKKLGDVARARLLFDCMPERDQVAWNSMIASYSKIGDISSARQSFDKMEEKNVISWSIMIDGYAQHGCPKESLVLFRDMLRQGIKPDSMSVMGVLSSSAQLGALDNGRWIHKYIDSKSISDMVVQTALIDMYMKCGSIYEACLVFKAMSRRSVLTWNVMITGLGMNGFGKSTLECLARILREGTSMDDLIFLSILNACGLAGFVKEGLAVFDLMRIQKVEPKLEHYGCLIDLLVRAGQLSEAEAVIESMPKNMKPNAAIWGSFLLACRVHKNVAMAERVIKMLVEMGADDCGAYILMSNIYAEAGNWECGMKMRRIMGERNGNKKKEAGRSVIEIDGDVAEFVSGKMVGTRNHQRLEEMLVSFSSLPIDEHVQLMNV